MIMNMVQALNSALDVMLEKNPEVLIFGEDVGYFGGVFRVTDKLQEKHGHHRCFDSPISEGGIIATGIGMAAEGLRPVMEIQFADYILPAYDQLVSEAARLRYRSNSDFQAPITVRAPYGGGIFGGQTHSSSPETIFAHITGLKTVIPSNPYDAKGLLIQSIECDDPIIFLEPKRLYNGPFEGYHDRPLKPWSGQTDSDVPEDYYSIPLGKAKVKKQGSEATVLAYGTMVHVALAGIRESGVDAELIDLRSIVPLDVVTIEESVKKTGRCLIVHEASKFSGFGAELSALITERCFYHLSAPTIRLAGWDVPYPHAFEWDYFPSPARVAKSLKQLLES